MITRNATIPRRITRRQLGKVLVGGAVGAECLHHVEQARAAGGYPFTIVLVPDPQFLASDQPCSGPAAYNALIAWAVDNRDLLVDGVPLNIKGLLQVGDCVNTTDHTAYTRPQSIAVDAYAQAESADMFVVRCCGNHDYALASDRKQLGYMFRNDKNGAWSPNNVAAIYGSGMYLRHGDVAWWGGAYPDPTFPVSTANHYMRLWIQGRRILVISLEFFPRSSVLNWARGLHDSYPDHECWITTHGYQDCSGARCTSASKYGPNAYGMGAAPACNSGTEMWEGSDPSWNGFTTWPNLTMVTCGHWIDGYAPASATSWVWQRLASTSTSSRGHTVQQIFCNCQNADMQNFCSGNAANPPNGIADAMHLMLLRITPATNKLESFLVSVNTGKWTGTYLQGGLNPSPIQLFDVDLAPPEHGVFHPVNRRGR